MMKVLKFIFGWWMWLILFILAILFNLICWNWKETYTMDLSVVIIEMCGKSTWECMFLNQVK